MAELPIIQVEFFSPDVTNAPTIDSAIERALERGMEGDRIKTVLRFTDRSRKLLKKIEAGQRRDQKINRDPLFVRLWRSFFSLDLDPGPSGMERSEGKLVSLTKKNLGKALRDPARLVATENYDHSFRPVNPDEVHELIERISRAQRAWFFVFSPNEDLCTDRPGHPIHYKM